MTHGEAQSAAWLALADAIIDATTTGAKRIGVDVRDDEGMVAVTLTAWADSGKYGVTVRVDDRWPDQGRGEIRAAATGLIATASR